MVEEVGPDLAAKESRLVDLVGLLLFLVDCKLVAGALAQLSAE